MATRDELKARYAKILAIHRAIGVEIRKLAVKHGGMPLRWDHDGKWELLFPDGFLVGGGLQHEGDSTGQTSDGDLS